MARKLQLIVLLLASLLTVTAYKTFFYNSNPSDRPDDSYVEHLGIPYAKTYSKDASIYARNLWDLQAFAGKLYIGAGNSSNAAPAGNAGPVPVIAWNPKSSKFETEFVVDDEQIDTFYVANGDLYIPGHDSTEAWQYGNLYRLSQGQWQKYRNVPNAVHVYALSAYKKLLLAGLSINTKGKNENARSAVGISTDWGETWQNIDLDGFRIHGFLKAKDILYSTDMFWGPGYEQRFAENNLQYVPVHEFNGEDNFIQRQDLSAKHIFPGFDLEGFQIYRIAKPQDWHSGTVYIGGYVHNDHQFMPFGLFYAADLSRDRTDVRRLETPNDTIVWDLIVHNNALYALLETNEQNSTKVSVIATNDLQHWQTILEFQSPTFARSFEILDGDFYFGLGGEILDPFDWQKKEPSSRTGELLRVKGKHFKLLR